MPSSAVGGGMAALMSASTIVAEAVEGSHVLKVDGNSKTKGLGNGKHIKSGTFNVGGHSWCIQYYPDGLNPDAADWISLCLELHHPNATDVNARFKLSLLDEMGEPVPSFTNESRQIRKFSSQSGPWGFKKFMERKALEESTYLVNDSFRVRCDVIVTEKIRTEAATQFVAVAPSNMHRHLGLLLFSGEGSDVTFEVAGQRIAAHRCVLAARSTVFMAELFGPMKEKTTNCIQIDDMEARVFKVMLYFIYTDSLPEMDKGDTLVMAQHLLVAADRYRLERLKLICEDKLCSYINTGTVATTLALAEQHGCQGLKEACFRFLKSPGNLKTSMESDSFAHLISSCPSLLQEILAKVAP